MGDFAFPLKAMFENIFGCHSCGDSIDMQWEESRNAAKHPTLHRTVPQNYSTHNASRADAEKP